MRKLGVLVLVLVGALAIVAWAAAPATGHTKALATTASNSSVTGSYGFAETIHDPTQGSPGGSGQEGTAVGTITFNGNGQFTGVYTQNTRGCSFATCGDLEVTRVPITGTDAMYPDGSATLDLCLDIGAGNLPVGNGIPQKVEAIWEGSFSLDFAHFRYTQTEIRSPCGVVGGPFGQVPAVVIGSAEKV